MQTSKRKASNASVNSESHSVDMDLFSNNTHRATPLVNDTLDNFWLDPGDSRVETGLQGGAKYGWDLLGSARLDYRGDRPIIYLGQANKKDQLPDPQTLLGQTFDDNTHAEYVDGDFVDHQYGSFDYFQPATKHDFKRHATDIVHFEKPKLDDLTDQPVMIKLTQDDKPNQASYIMSVLTLKGWGRGICQNLPVLSNSELVIIPYYQKLMGELLITLTDKQGQQLIQFETQANKSQYIYQIPNHLNMVRIHIQPAKENTNFLNAGFQGLVVRTGSFVQINTDNNTKEVEIGQNYTANIILTNKGHSSTTKGVLRFQTSEAIMNDLQIEGYDYKRQGNNFEINIPAIQAQDSIKIKLKDTKINKNMRNEYVIGNIQYEYATRGTIVNKKEIPQIGRGQDFAFKVNTPMKTILFIDQYTGQQLGSTEVDASESIKNKNLPVPAGYKLNISDTKLNKIFETDNDIYQLKLDHQMIPMPQKKVVSREIVIHYPNNEDPEQITQSATFYRNNYQDAITHELHAGEWTADGILPARNLKTIQGYQPNQSIPEMRVSHNDGDSHIEIYYNELQTNKDKQNINHKTDSNNTMRDKLAQKLEAAKKENETQKSDSITITYKAKDHQMRTIILPNTTDYNEIQKFLTNQFNNHKLEMDDALNIFDIWLQKYSPKD